MPVMESFFKNSSADGQAVFNAALDEEKSDANKQYPKRYTIQRRSTEEILSALGVLFFVLGFCVQYWAAGSILLMSLVVIASIVAAIAFISYGAVIELTDDNIIKLYKGSLPLRTVLKIPLATVQFVGISSGDKFQEPKGNHVVYLRHQDQLSPIRSFKIGREAVMMAKSLKVFIGN